MMQLLHLGTRTANAVQKNEELATTTTTTTTTTISRPLYRSTCIMYSQHLQLRTGGFCFCEKFYWLHGLADANHAFRLRKRRWNSLHSLRTFKLTVA